MPVTIEAGCIGFHIVDTDGADKIQVVADDLKAVHLAIDHHYWRYLSKKGEQHNKGTVKGCPLCELMQRRGRP